MNEMNLLCSIRGYALRFWMCFFLILSCLVLFPQSGWALEEKKPEAGKDLSLPIISVEEKSEKTSEQQMPIFLPAMMPDSTAWRKVTRLPKVEEEKPSMDFVNEEDWKNVEANYEMAVQGKEKSDIAAKIRFSFFPCLDVHSIDDNVISKPKTFFDQQERARQAEENVKKDKKKADDILCADNFSKERQRQLDAIKSDHQTLVALKNAMTELGVSERLSFMSEQAESVPKLEPPSSKEQEKTESN